jgi:uncharacterized protein with ACT and thioredoxin-like domain
MGNENIKKYCYLHIDTDFDYYYFDIIEEDENKVKKLKKLNSVLSINTHNVYFKASEFMTEEIMIYFEFDNFWISNFNKILSALNISIEDVKFDENVKNYKNELSI